MDKEIGDPGSNSSRSLYPHRCKYPCHIWAGAAKSSFCSCDRENFYETLWVMNYFSLSDPLSHWPNVVSLSQLYCYFHDKCPDLLEQNYLYYIHEFESSSFALYSVGKKEVSRRQLLPRHPELLFCGIDFFDLIQ